MTDLLFCCHQNQVINLTGHPVDDKMNRPARAHSPVVSGDKRSLSVVGTVLVILSVRLEEFGEGGGRPLGFADDDVRDGRPLHRTLSAIRKRF